MLSYFEKKYEKKTIQFVLFFKGKSCIFAEVFLSKCT